MAYETQECLMEQKEQKQIICSCSVVSVIEVIKKMKVQHRQEFSTSIKVNH